MNRIATLLILLITLCIPATLFVGQSSAVDIFSNTCGSSASGTDVCKDVGAQNAKSTNPVINVIKVAIDVISYMIGIGAVIGVIVSGLRIMLAGGDTSKVASARSGLVYSIVGVVIAVIAQAIVVLVIEKIK